MSPELPIDVLVEGANSSCAFECNCIWGLHFLNQLTRGVLVEDTLLLSYISLGKGWQLGCPLYSFSK
jgi:hypothetical protein